MSNTNKKFVAWILSVALVALIAGHFVTPGPVRDPNQIASHSGGRGAVTHVQPGATQANGAQAQPASQQPGAQINPAQPPPSGGRFASRAAAPTMTVAQLYATIDSQPQTIRLLTFVNGKNQVKADVQNVGIVTVLLPDEGGKQELRQKAQAAKIPFAVTEEQVDPVASFIGNNIGLFLLVGVFLFIFFAQRKAQQAQAGRLNSMGASRAKDASKHKVAPVKFKDVAGCEEAVKELRRVVKGLVGRQIYSLFDAELPRGILLIGPPGTGKTLLAKAVAGESDGTFDITSGSDFVEMLVGVGASRVRDLFAKARAKVAATGKPHIIFIDEIDAVGGKRGGGASTGSNSEREQTLNQILVEMDGMVSNEGIIIVAATNRIDMLDDALLRPGRFDCHVSVDLPDKSGREAIFAIHLAKKPLAAEVTLAVLAHRTYTYSGAEIKGVCNRAAIIAAERFDAARQELLKQGLSPAEVAQQIRPEITLRDFDEAIDFVRYGGAATSKQKNMPLKEKKNTSVHEGGHACASAVFPDSDPVTKITIMRRSKALGYVQYMPENDRTSFTYEQAIARIVTAMAGRAAQEMILNTIDTGASNDFQQATDMARKMVTVWGMSRLGNISVGDRPDGPFAGYGGGHQTFGPDLANEIDREWRYIVDTCFAAACTIVDQDRERIEALVTVLLDQETVLAHEWEALLEKYPSKVDLESLKLPERTRKTA